MDNFHHKQIKRFSLEGMIHDESAIGRLKDEYIRLLVSEMRLTGYVPRFDIDPDFTIDYNEKKQNFIFELSLYGTYVGKKKSKWILGLDRYRAISIPQNKLSEYSQEQV